MWKLTADQKADAVVLYDAGKSSSAIASEFGVSEVAIRGILKRRGVTIRDNSFCQRARSLNEQSFVDLTPEASYWIGFLMADGCIVGREVGISVSATDIGHLEEFRSFMGSDHAITSVTPKPWGGWLSKPSARFSFKSAKIVADLAKHGVVPRKSMLAKASPECASNRDFWRGVIDGDGTLDAARTRPSRQGAVVRLCGSKPLLDQFATFVASRLPDWRGSVRPHKGIFCVAVTGLLAEDLILILYDNATYALERKTNAARNILQARALAVEPPKRTLRRVGKRKQPVGAIHAGV